METAFVAFELAWYAAFAATIYYGWKRVGAAFFVPAAIWGFLLEFSAQELFARYHYGGGFLVYVLNVPLCISLAWASLMYWGYYYATEKMRIGSTAKIALATALPLLAIDVLILEPLAKIFGYWTWTPESVWFGSPIGNIVGWFFVIVLFAGAYHLVEMRIKEGWKRLLANMLAIAPNLVVLMIILQLWLSIFGML